MIGRRNALAVSLGWLLLALQPAASAPAPSLESAVKATFLYKFIPFVQWPAGAFQAADSPVTICVFGNDPVSALIDDAIANQRAEQRPLIVRHVDAVRRDGCHILYVAAGNPQAAEQALASVRGAPVLTVTDAARAPAATGIVNFELLGNRVGFDIDGAAAAQNGLAISSKLLSLARQVRTRP
jgi:hypothetical protein